MPVDPNHVHSTGSKFAQLLSNVLIEAHPWLSEISEQTKHRVKDEWLEGLEKHATSIVEPIIDKVFDAADMPDEIAALFEHAARPKAQFGATIQQFFVWGVMFSLASTALEPFTQDIANALWSVNPSRPLTPPDIASMVIRGIAPGDAAITPMPGWAADEGKKSGIPPSDMQALIDVTGQPPSPTDLFEMVRRSLIDESKVEQGLREGDTRDEWIPLFSKLRYETPTPIDMVRAAVQAQLPYDQAKALASELGLEPAGFVNDNPDWFDTLFHIAGRPPGPEEVGRMANRGIVPWEGTGADATTFQQAIAESDIKTKWTDALRQLQVYVPPPRMVGGLLKSGSITAEQAKQFWIQGGVPNALADAYVHQATTEETIQEKNLSKTEVTTLLYDGIIDGTQAADLLSVLGFQGKTATYIVELTNFRRRMSFLSTAVRRVSSLYVNYRMTAVDAKASLDALGVPSDQVIQLLEIWDIERKPEVRLPTIAQLGRAVRYSGLDFGVAVSKGMALGYTEYDATLIIAGEAEEPPPNGWPTDADTGVDV